jgi:fatty acid desaturase
MKILHSRQMVVLLPPGLFRSNLQFIPKRFYPMEIPATDKPADSPADASASRDANRTVRWLWTMVALTYAALAVYTAWFSVDKDMVQAGTWFALGVCFFCMGLIPMNAAAETTSTKAPLNTRSRVSSDLKD